MSSEQGHESKNQPLGGRISVVIPAYNEERSIIDTLTSVKAAAKRVSADVEIIVVDNASTDATATVAADAGVQIVNEHTPGPAAARNAGARAADGDLLLFIDADVILSEWAMLVMLEQVNSRNLKIGGLKAIYEPEKLISWFICAFWDRKRAAGGPCQGVAQFCEANLFRGLGGYNERLMMSEDFDFYLRAGAADQAAGGPGAVIIKDAIVWPSSRRYNKWSNARMLAMQNHVIVKFFRNSRVLWKSWRTTTVR